MAVNGIFAGNVNHRGFNDAVSVVQRVVCGNGHHTFRGNLTVTVQDITPHYGSCIFTADMSTVVFDHTINVD